MCIRDRYQRRVRESFSPQHPNNMLLSHTNTALRLSSSSRTTSLPFHKQTNCCSVPQRAFTSNNSFYDFVPLDIHKKPFSFKTLQGKVVLIVNVASRCGFTAQYSGLQKLYDKYKDQGFLVIGFPCNQFGGQEPGSNEAIENFCSTTYSVTFPIMDKVEVNGENEHPVYHFLKNAQPGITGLVGYTKIKWNFEKFLVNKQGRVVNRYTSLTTPESLSSVIENLLKE
eukprot:TRINITY_DN2546_c0_g1_i1.p1 TRINITY_DN2546_c0_g1~~TRINITY_DN2546_c0_g1_i1.p1  ORF type:complete len:226 (-),score=59.44 TRINITY_DN2546_c0_g1_i1:120-797(-)